MAAERALDQARTAYRRGRANWLLTPKRGSRHSSKYRDAYRRYCWPVSSINDLKLAPFHLLATEGEVHTDKQHTWHMEMLAESVPRPIKCCSPHRFAGRPERPGKL